MNRYPFQYPQDGYRQSQQSSLDPGPGAFLFGGLLALFAIFWPLMLHGPAEIAASVLWYGTGLVVLIMVLAARNAREAESHRQAPPPRLVPPPAGLPDLRESGEFAGQ